MILIAALIILLQLKLWRGEGSIPQVKSLKKEAALLDEKVKELRVRNQTLEAEVRDLKHHLGALEELSRSDLGMIRQGETFYQYSTPE